MGENWDRFSERVEALLSLGRVAEAQSLVSIELARDPDLAQTWILMARVLAPNADEQAIRTGREAVSRAPTIQKHTSGLPSR